MNSALTLEDSVVRSRLVEALVGPGQDGRKKGRARLSPGPSCIPAKAGNIRLRGG